MKAAPFILMALFAFSCTSNAPENTPLLSPELQACLGPELVRIIDLSERELDEFILEQAKINGQENLSLEEQYKAFLAPSVYDSNAEIFLEAEIPEAINDILKKEKVREIFDWSENLGYDIAITEPGGKHYELNELSINHAGKFLSCLKTSSDSLAIIYLDLKESLDVNYVSIAEFYHHRLKQKKFSESPLLKKLIAIELYLRPMCLKYLEK